MSFVKNLLSFILVMLAGATANNQLKILTNENGGKIPLKAYIVFNDGTSSKYLKSGVDECFLKGKKNAFDINIVFKEIREFKIINNSFDEHSTPYNDNDEWFGYTSTVALKLGVTVSIYSSNNELVSTGTFTYSQQGQGTFYTKFNTSVVNGQTKANKNAIQNITDSLDNIISTDIANWYYKSKEIKYYADNRKMVNNTDVPVLKTSAVKVPLPTTIPEAFGWDASKTSQINLLSSSKSLPFSPFDLINRRVQALVDSFMVPRSPIDISSKIPAEISVPKLEPAPELVRDRFSETKDDFMKRVEKIKLIREETVNNLQRTYRNDVEIRNKKVDALRRARDLDIAAILSEQEHKKGQIPAKTYEFTRQAFYEVMGAPLLDTIDYDPDKKTIYLWLKALNADYKERISFSVEPSIAKEMFYNVNDRVVPNVVFSLKGGQIRILDIWIHYEDNTYQAKVDGNEVKIEPLKVVIKDQKISVDSLNQLRLTLQDPNLRDTYVVKAIGYDQQSEQGSDDFVDDLTPLVKRLKKAPTDTTKWLFMIAIEKYDNTDPVIYAENSAYAVKTAFQNIFGICDRNTYDLIGDKATAGAIKDRMTQLLDDDLNEGDMIYFYYSGHGIPDPASKEPYILPKDKIVDYIVREPDFKLDEIYSKLKNSKASRVVAFVDACFSGKTDNVTLFKGVAAPALIWKTVNVDTDKMLVLTAGGGDQFSNMFKLKGHRMFTYFLLTSLISPKNTSLESIFRETQENVKNQSNRIGPAFFQVPQYFGNLVIKLY